MTRLKTALAVLIAAPALIAAPLPAAQAQADPQHRQCLGWALSGGYPGGIAQLRCEAGYPGLPNPFQVRCALIADGAAATDLQRRACAAAFARPPAMAAPVDPAGPVGPVHAHPPAPAGSGTAP